MSGPDGPILRKRAARRRQAATGKFLDSHCPCRQAKRKHNNQLLENMLHLADLVVMAGSLAPVPIPNTAVKCPSADGTLS